ncbi:glycosyl hydrolase family 79 N-terminal domain-containing protein [Govanella unica]|uniref:Uncharacterized protein n=1 Tax=Govanella unica TaxID=2975056 RepID=A0A9X3Z7J6_9PROT|nr:hypothetical protein [Govania unica]MDA5194325.1 hypothetical protein [Govania unica]
MGAADAANAITLLPSDMTRITTVDDRYQSYNVEMAEVIGGTFWKPYNRIKTGAADAKHISDTAPQGIAFQLEEDDLFEARPPIDLANPRLRKLAVALGPAYVRVSGTWANSVYFQDTNSPKAHPPPKGFTGTLTRREWAGVINFAKASEAKIVTSFTISAGVRDKEGGWTPVEAAKLLAYTKSLRAEIAAAELFNEPNIAIMGGAPLGYDAETFGKDIAAFRAFVKSAAPGMLIAGPGSVGEGGALMTPKIPVLKSSDLLGATPAGAFDVFSYHFYGAASERCATSGSGMAGTTKQAALSEAWLAQTDQAFRFYEPLRNRYARGKPIWVTETADAACGGNPWAATFLDSFRYLDQLGRLARLGVKVVFHNTLVSSDYGLIDQTTLTPRPNYWAALLWHRLMGKTVLEAGPTLPSLHLYAHCLRGTAGGVALLAINTNQTAGLSVDLRQSSKRYALTAQRLDDAVVRLNGHDLKTKAAGDLPAIKGEAMEPGPIALAPASITFLAVSDAKNRACL